ncbi:MAG TPA: hypothetical protein VI653_28470 [Steroidobacteraceae bacterium]
MNELLSDPKFSLFVVSALGALLMWLGKGYTRRLEALEREAVRKKDLKELREDLRSEHKQNTEKLDSIESAVTGTHRRIDDLYRDLMKQKLGS